MIVSIDFETRSRIGLDGGAWKYAGHPSTEVVCMAIKKDNEPAKLLWAEKFELLLGLESEMSWAVAYQLIMEAERVEAHNAEFEIAIWERVLKGPNYPRWHCTMAKAAMHALPLSLEKLCEALNSPIQKDKKGNMLMKKICQPQKDGTFIDDPDIFRAVGEYCRTDVEAQYMASRMLDDLIPIEQAIWKLTIKKNKTGLPIDMQLVENAIAIWQAYEEKLEAEFVRLTGVPSPSCLAQFLSWLEANGCDLTDLRAATVAEALTKFDGKVRRALEIRVELGKTSIKKFESLRGIVEPDGRARGLFLYHGAATGRWAGRGFQPQNLPSRGLISEVPMATKMLLANSPVEDFDLLWPSLSQVLSSCIRAAIKAPAGKTFFCADFSAIEARVLAWLAGEQWVLDAYSRDEDLYTKAASKIYHKPEGNITKSERQIGKVSVLACIAEDQLVLTDRGLVAIQNVLLSDKVWDGVDFVTHGGVVYKGEKEVLGYEGLIATSDHLVWVEGAPEPIHFINAARSGQHLVKSGAGRQNIRVGEDHQSRKKIHSRVVGVLRSHSMPRVQRNSVDSSRQFNAGQEQRLPRMLAAKANTYVARQAINGGQTTMSESTRQAFSGLWREGNRVSFRVCNRGGVVYPVRVWGAIQRAGNRPDRQQWPLREGQSQIRHTETTDSKPQEYQNRKLEPRRMALLTECGVAVSGGRPEPCGDIALGRNGGPGETKKLAWHSSKVKVFDLVNCGPRNRFTVSDCLVHNCGYAGGKQAFAGMAANYGISIDLDEAQEIVTGWRQANPKIVEWWYELERAAINAIKEPGTSFHARSVCYHVDSRGYLRCFLPSGRTLYYPEARLGLKTTPWGEQKQVILYNTVVNGKYQETHTYSGCLAENVTQAVARDLMAYAMLNLESAGFSVLASIHDELLVEFYECTNIVEHFDEFLRQMVRLPSWAKGLPIKAEGWRGERYRK